MAKEQAVRVNLKTQAKEILATMREEMPKAYYFFRKNFGGKQKYLKHEDQMVDKALEEKNDQFTDIDYWISKVGNRWMTYTQAEYFPQAMYANAFHYSFIYYETMASCGAFFPMYDQKELKKKGKVTDKSKITGVILYTDHFFYQMSERTKIEYRSKELIKKFISTRLENALTVDENGEAIVKFKGGHGFGKQYSKNPQFIAIRTFLRDEELNAKQRRACEPVDTLYELTKDGAFMKEIQLNTALLQDPMSKEAIDENMKKYEAMKKLGMEKHVALFSSLGMIFTKILEDKLQLKLNYQQQTLVAHFVSWNAIDFVKKWVNEDANGRDDEFKKDMVDVFCKAAKDMKLKSFNRDTISYQLEKMYEEGKKASDNNQDS
jgi:hypothetical protein